MTTAGSPVRGRSTRQRAAVAAALDEVAEFRSAQELHDMLKHKGDSVGLTTVYRTLQSLADAGEVDVLRTDDGEIAGRIPKSTFMLLERRIVFFVDDDNSKIGHWSEHRGSRS